MISKNNDNNSNNNTYDKYNNKYNSQPHLFTLPLYTPKILILFAEFIC